jgi:hypothetical protein
MEAIYALFCAFIKLGLVLVAGYIIIKMVRRYAP